MRDISMSQNISKQQYWQQTNGWQQSGFSQKQFCHNQSLSLSTFTYWKKKLRGNKSSQPRFYPLVIPGSQEHQLGAATSVLRLEVKSGKYHVEVPENFSVPTLKRLLVLLGQQ